MHTRLPRIRRCPSSKLPKNRNMDSVLAFAKICIISKCSLVSSMKIRFLIFSNCGAKECKNHKQSCISTYLIFQNLRFNSISGETVPLKCMEMSWEMRKWKWKTLLSPSGSSASNCCCVMIKNLRYKPLSWWETRSSAGANCPARFCKFQPFYIPFPRSAAVLLM